MKPKISVVIVCKNEEHIIGKTLQSVQSFADEVLVYDTGSTDNTITIAKAIGATVIEAPWEGYGKSKGKAIGLASHDWILNLDSDEVVNEDAQKNIRQLGLNDETFCYRFRFKNFLGEKALKWGEFGFDSHIRLFNRRQVRWNDAPVHESLLRSPGVKERLVKGFILHYTMKDTTEYIQKSVTYALVNAENYFRQGKKATWVKQYLGPPITFIKYYFIRLGFLDGWVGLFSARMAALYTYLKYARLRELQERSSKVR